MECFPVDVRRELISQQLKEFHLKINKTVLNNSFDDTFKEDCVSRLYHTPMEELSSENENQNEDQSLFKDSTSSLGNQKYKHNYDDSKSFRVLHTADKQDRCIEALQQNNPYLTTQIVEFNLPGECAEYSLIRVPKNINPNTLQNLKYSFDKEVLNKKQYLFQPLTKKPKTILVNLNGPILVTLNKIIVLKKTSPLIPLNNIKAYKRENVSLPEAIKPRHPLFGVDYKEKINIKKKIKKKILEAVERKIYLEKKEKTKKNRGKRNLNLVDDEKKVLSLLNFNTSKKNK